MIKNKLLLFTIFLISAQCLAFELDTSIDDEIRKNYNPSAIENSLPALPKTSPTNPLNSTQPQTVAPKTLPETEKKVVKVPLKKMHGTSFSSTKRIPFPMIMSSCSQR